MKTSRTLSRPGYLRLFLRNRKSLTVTVLAVAVTTAVVAQAAASGGVSSVCLSQEAASDQKGGWISPAVGPATIGKQIIKGATRRSTIWSGPVQECAANSADNCNVSYYKGESVSYHKVIDLAGGLLPIGGPEFRHIVPIISGGITIRDETKTTAWNIARTAVIKPGQRAKPIVNVNYEEWSGNFVGGYIHDAETKGCHAYHLEPTQEFGHWHGEVAQTEYASWDIQ